MKLLSKTLAALGVAAVAATAMIPAGSALAAPPKFQDHGSYGIYNNYKGDRNRHDGYRYYNGFWFPPAAFVAGAVVGSLLAQPAYPQTYTYSYAPSGHLAYCQQTYRSYNPATDTFLGYDGAYHYCVSPDQQQYGY